MANPRTRILQALASSATGRTSLELNERRIQNSTLIAAIRANLVVAHTSALSMSTNYHLTRTGRAAAAALGIEIKAPSDRMQVLLSDKTVKPLAEVL